MRFWNEMEDGGGTQMSITVTYTYFCILDQGFMALFSNWGYHKL